MVNSPHGKGVTFTIRSAPVGYAAEYLTRSGFTALTMGCFPLMSICCILYHFSGVHRILLTPPRQFRRGLGRHRSFEFYRSSTSSSSTIVFNQQHRWVTHSTPTPCEKKLSNLPFSHFPAAIPPRSDLIVQANNSIPIIPPTTPYNPKSVLPNAASTHRLINSPHTSAYKLRPYVATMFKNIRRFGDMPNVANVKVLPITNTQQPIRRLVLLVSHSIALHNAQLCNAEP